MKSKTNKKNTELNMVSGTASAVFVVCIILFLGYAFNHLSVSTKLPGNLDTTTGRNLTLPDKYAKLLPIYPESRIFSIIEGKENGKETVTIGTRIKADIHTATEWHTEGIKNMGYTVDDSATMNEVTNIWFHKEQYKGSITLSNKDYAHPGKTTEEVRVTYFISSQ